MPLTLCAADLLAGATFSGAKTLMLIAPFREALVALALSGVGGESHSTTASSSLVEQRLPSQIKEIMTYENLNNLKDLERGWDGYGAEPISLSVIARASKFIATFGNSFGGAPQIVPMTKGRLQFEWHQGNRSLEVEIGDSSEIHYLKWDSDLDLAEEDVASISDKETVQDILAWFSSEKRNVDPRRTGTKSLGG
jgi:hypothetical protein